MSLPWKRNPDYDRVCLLGLGDAGKTILLCRLVLGETVATYNPNHGVLLWELQLLLPYIQGQSINNIHSPKRSTPRLKTYISRSGI